MDVFISYSHDDKAWVCDELLPRIEQAGLRAVVDYRDFKPGLAAIKQMERAIAECKKTLLVLTPSYLQSDWAELEYDMLQTLDPKNDSARLIPLLKVSCELSPRIRRLTYVDFTNDTDRDLAWRQLLTALGAPPPQPETQEEKPEEWFLAHPYAMPPNFTGRLAERTMLTEWLTNDPAHSILVLRALGGFGKSSLVWYWLLNDIDRHAWPRVVWWSFYEAEAGFDSFVEETLSYLGVEPGTAPRGRAEALLKALRDSGTLLVLDGFERALTAFSGLGAAYQGDETISNHEDDRTCVSPLAELFLRHLATHPNVRAKVLLTTRLRPAILEVRGGMLLNGCRENELSQLQPEDGVSFFHAEGIRGTRSEIELTCERYGYHPLCLRLLAGMIVSDLQQPGDVASADRLDVGGDLVQRRHHVLEESYARLSRSAQLVLGRIACFRGAIDYDALKAVASWSNVQWETDVRQLLSRGLLHRDLSANRFDLHPIVRRYAYSHMEGHEHVGAHERLREYFAALASPVQVFTVDDLAAVIELYHHTARAGRYDEALKVFSERIHDGAFFQLGAYTLIIDLLRALFPDGEDMPPKLSSEQRKSWVLIALANAYSLTGHPLRAKRLLEQANAIDERAGARQSLLIGLVNLASRQIATGFLAAAAKTAHRAMTLAQELEDPFLEAACHQALGQIWGYCGRDMDSQEELHTALRRFEEQQVAQSQGVVWAYCSWAELLRWRFDRDAGSPAVAIANASRALEFAESTSRGGVARDYIRAYWTLGAAYGAASRFTEAEASLDKALERCRGIQAVDHEAPILVDVGLLHLARRNLEAAKDAGEQALSIAGRSGYVLTGADTHVLLAKIAQAHGDKPTARKHATAALRLATCDGPPDYTYKAAYVEAEALLKELG